MGVAVSVQQNFDEYKLSNNPVEDLRRKIRHNMVPDIKEAQAKLKNLEKKKS